MLKQRNVSYFSGGKANFDKTKQNVNIEAIHKITFNICLGCSM